MARAKLLWQCWAGEAEDVKVLAPGAALEDNLGQYHSMVSVDELSGMLANLQRGDLLTSPSSPRAFICAMISSGLFSGTATR